jgi:hypothetical protein
MLGISTLLSAILHTSSVRAVASLAMADTRLLLLGVKPGMLVTGAFTTRTV